jgi:hypothetical protein
MSVRATYGVGRQGVAILPLALIVLLHLLLVLLWQTTTRVQVDPRAEQRHFTLIPLPRLRPRAQALPAPARTPQAPARVAKPRAAPAPRTLEGAPTSVAQALPDTEQLPQASTAAAPAAPDVGHMIETAKRQAGMVDRALRGGKLAPLTPDPELPITRFRHALEGAYNDRSRTLVTDSYTQPDGVVVYRHRLGGKVWCRQSGGSAPGMLERSDGAKLAGAGSAGGAGAAGTIKCPLDETGWTRR